MQEFSKRFLAMPEFDGVICLIVEPADRVDEACIYNAGVLPPTLVWMRDAKGETVVDQIEWNAITSSAEESS